MLCPALQPVKVSVEAALDVVSQRWAVRARKIDRLAGAGNSKDCFGCASDGLYVICDKQGG